MNVNDDLASGYRVEGLVAFLSTFTASIVSVIAGDFNQVNPTFGAIPGALVGALIYFIYSKI